MKNRTIKQISMAVGLIVVWSNILYANKFEKSNAKVEVEAIKLITIAGKQRMLSQRIAKDYLYIGKNIASSKANKQLKLTMNEFVENYEKLSKNVNDEEIKNLLEFVKLSLDDLNALVKEDFSMDNAQLILDLSESMLEGSQYVFDSLKDSVNFTESKVLVNSTKQRMLSQRIAKYYIAYQLGIEDINSVKSMKKTVEQFSQNLDALIKNSSNTPEVTKKLNEINRLWKIVHKFYINIEKGGLPLIVFNTTDTITKKMDEITNIYVSIHK